jgi:hypothetical protein
VSVRARKISFCFFYMSKYTILLYPVFRAFVFPFACSSSRALVALAVGTLQVTTLLQIFVPFWIQMLCRDGVPNWCAQFVRPRACPRVCPELFLASVLSLPWYSRDLKDN